PLRPADNGPVRVVLSYGPKSDARLSVSRPGKCAAFVLFAGAG
ncbi:MAG: hypothetical protein QOK40_602, partial [Miltoncostaeaceae bacterium]|nr:hypothetical protein [Miltoncostaeaceae bacterium]